MDNRRQYANHIEWWYFNRTRQRTSKHRGNEGSSWLYCGVAKVCGDYTTEVGVVTYENWFLPSKDELNLMYKKLHNIDPPAGGFTDSLYWSSSEDNANSAWSQNFNDGNPNNFLKNSTNRVRAVRAF